MLLGIVGDAEDVRDVAQAGECQEGDGHGPGPSASSTGGTWSGRVLQVGVDDAVRVVDLGAVGHFSPALSRRRSSPASSTLVTSRSIFGGGAVRRRGAKTNKATTMTTMTTVTAHLPIAVLRPTGRTTMRSGRDFGCGSLMHLLVGVTVGAGRAMSLSSTARECECIVRITVGFPGLSHSVVT